MDKDIAIFWFRRDLRMHDNAGLHKALTSGQKVLPLFIFDQNILDKLESKEDARVHFIHDCLTQINATCEKHGGQLLVEHGDPKEIWKRLIKKYKVSEVYTNRDYEPYAQQRDQDIYAFLADNDITFKGYKDHVIFEKSEVTKDDGSPYSVFSPYMKKWKKTLQKEHLDSYPIESQLNALVQTRDLKFPSLADIGFEESGIDFPKTEVSEELLEAYGDRRDIPSVRGTSRLSVHLRFGSISIRQLAQKGFAHSEKWLNELIWRDFYQMLIFHFPHTVDHSFKPKYDGIPWLNDEDHFNAWCQGKTGYPIVDAGMRELNRTGFMHNRVRMIVASFLTKHLLIDWKWGERYFAEKLLDFELASNVGGWQWAASCGADAAPYFRVFNPESQQKKFDPSFKYIKRWVPEFGSPSYPAPIVEHKMARQRAIDTFKAHLS